MRVTREQAIRILLAEANEESWPSAVANTIGLSCFNEDGDVELPDDYPTLYDVLEALGVPPSERIRIEESWPPEKAAERSKAPYRVEVEHMGCCAASTCYVVVGPDDGDAGGVSFVGEDGEMEAEDLAEVLNDAYAEGSAASPHADKLYKLAREMREALRRLRELACQSACDGMHNAECCAASEFTGHIELLDGEVDDG